MPRPKSKEVVLPKTTLGACVDQLGEIREKISKLSAEEKKIRELKSALEDRLINELPASDSNGIAGKKHRATIVTKVVPQVKDWKLFLAYIVKTKGFDMLARQVTKEAILERWNAKQKVPGVVKFIAKKVSLTKI